MQESSTTNIRNSVQMIFVSPAGEHDIWVLMLWGIIKIVFVQRSLDGTSEAIHMKYLVPIHLVPMQTKALPTW